MERKIYKDVTMERFKYYFMVIYCMYEDAEFQAPIGLYRLLERHKIPREKTIAIGSYALYLQGKLRKGDKPSDIDLIVRNEEDFNQIIEALDKEGNEETSTVHIVPDFISRTSTVYVVSDSISRDVLQFKYEDQDFDIFRGDIVDGFLSGNVDAAEKVEVNGEIIYVRPLGLIKTDIEKAIYDIKDRIKQENEDIQRFRQRNLPPDTADDIAIREHTKRLSELLSKYQERLAVLSDI